MAERWPVNVCRGECVSGDEKDSREETDQTWMLLSALPERRKLEDASTTRAVTDCKCACDVTTNRPLCVYHDTSVSIHLDHAPPLHR